jgi:FAD binding domain/Berberine and berberine like
MTIAHLTQSVQRLQKHIAGRILTPNDPAYEQTRRGWNLTIDQHPALILVAANAQDVIAGVRFAREQGLSIGVKSTGHGIQYPADDNLLIVTSQMTAVHVDPQTRTAQVEAGVIWKQVLDAATPFGLAPLLGTSPHVGVIGYTLGGGIGWLARRYGLAADSVRSIEIVTADGVLRHTAPEEHSDLFWGLRGGGGNFGVVTAIEFKLYPVSTMYGGSLTYPGELASDALRLFRDWSKSVPDELTSSIGIIKFPPLPQVPEAMRGKLQVLVRAAFAGNAGEGQALIQPWLDWRTPGTNTFQEMPFSEIGTIQNDPVAPTASASSSEMFDDLSDEAIDIIVRCMTDAASPLVFSELRHAGGAIARADADASAVGNREATFNLVIGALVITPEARTAIQAAIEHYKADLRPYLRGGVYLNFMAGFLAGSELRDRTKDAYLHKTFERLVELKARYDPENVFRFSYQLVP